MATTFDPEVVMRGQVGSDDDDFFSVTVSAEAQVWRLDAAGAGLTRIAWLRPDGSFLADAMRGPDSAIATLTDIHLGMGEHVFWVQGEGDYTPDLTPFGARDPDAEREPNDDSFSADSIRVGQLRRGRLADSADRDVYRFSVAADDHLSINVEVPPDGSIDARLMNRDWVLGSF
jgi:hypothetical protein